MPQAVITSTEKTPLLRRVLHKIGITKSNETIALKDQSLRLEHSRGLKNVQISTPFYNWEFFRNELEFE